MSGIKGPFRRKKRRNNAAKNTERNAAKCAFLPFPKSYVTHNKTLSAARNAVPLTNKTYVRHKAAFSRKRSAFCLSEKEKTCKHQRKALSK